MHVRVYRLILGCFSGTGNQPLSEHTRLNLSMSSPPSFVKQGVKLHVLYFKLIFLFFPHKVS